LVKTSVPGTGALTTPSFAPSNGEDIVVKLGTWDTGSPMGAPTGGGQTYTSRVINAPGGFNEWCGIYTTTISGSPGSMTISSTPSVSAQYSMLVERWPTGSLAASPVTNSNTGFSAAASGTITPTAGTSVISWVSGDAQSIDPATRAYLNSGTDEGVRDGHVGSNGVEYYGYQAASGTSSQSYGLSAPTGQTFVIAAIEILDTAGAPANPDPIWAPHRLVPPGRISPAGFWVPWSGDLAVNATAQAAPTEATGAGTALDAAVAIAANAVEAAGSGAALSAAASVAANAVEATATGAALDAVTSVAANAAEATATGAALDAVAAVAALPGSADATGTAYDATVSTSGSTNAPADVAAATGSAADATAAIGANATEAAATGAANSAAVGITANAAEAVGTGSALDAAAALGVNAAEATATGAALDATVSTSASTNAPATEAVGAGTAYDATITITTFAGVAAATAVAYDATVTIGAPGSAFAGVAAATGQAFDARVRKLIPRPFTGTTTRPYSGVTLRP